MIPTTKVHIPPPSPSAGSARAPVRIPLTEPPGGEEEKPRKNVCPYCDISCTKPSVLDKHIRTHTNERPYPCNPCKIAFKTQSNLYKHCRSRTHALKVEQGIDSSSAEMVAELGDSFKEELERHNQYPHGVPMQQQPTPLVLEPQRLLPHTTIEPSPPQQPRKVTETLVIEKESSLVQSGGTHALPPQVLQSVQRLQYTQPPVPRGGAVLIKAPMPGPSSGIPEELPRDLSQSKSISFMPPQQRPVAFIPQPPQPSYKPSQTAVTTPKLPLGSSISLTNSVELSPRPVGPDFLQQRIDKVISENQAIVETWDPLWPRRYMRQNSKDPGTASSINGPSESVVTVEKTNRKIMFASTPSQVTMSLVTSASLPTKSVQVHNLTTQSMASGSSVTSSHHPAPLSIQLARPSGAPQQNPVVPQAPQHPTLTVVPSGLRLDQTSLVVVRQPEVSHPQRPPAPHQVTPSTLVSHLSSRPSVDPTQDLMNPKNLKEVWGNRVQHPSQQPQIQPFAQQTRLITPMDTSQDPKGSDGAMIKELLRKTRGATTLEPAGPTFERRDSSSSSGSNSNSTTNANPGSNQIVIQVTKAPFDPQQVKLALPNVSLILTPTTSNVVSTSTSALTVTSMPIPKTRILPQNFINSHPTLQPSEIKVNVQL